DRPGHPLHRGPGAIARDHGAPRGSCRSPRAPRRNGDFAMSNRDREWLETDGLGGFASGTVSGLRTRRYHGLLVTATTPPTGRMMLVSGLDVSIETPGGQWMLSTQRYAPDVIGGHGEDHVESFKLDPWPTWIFRLPDGTRVM